MLTSSSFIPVDHFFSTFLSLFIQSWASCAPCPCNSMQVGGGQSKRKLNTRKRSNDSNCELLSVGLYRTWPSSIYWAVDRNISSSIQILPALQGPRRGRGWGDFSPPPPTHTHTFFGNFKELLRKRCFQPPPPPPHPQL